MSVNQHIIKFYELTAIEYTSRSTLVVKSIKLLPRPGENDNTDIVLRSRNNNPTWDSDVVMILVLCINVSVLRLT